MRIIELVLVASVLCALLNTVVSFRNEDGFPKLLYMAPKDYHGVYDLNQRDSLTNKVKTGWIIQEGEEIEFIVYIAVLDEIYASDEVGKGYIYFTTNIHYCDYVVNSTVSKKDADIDTSDVFPLRLIRERTKFVLPHIRQQQEGGAASRAKRRNQRSEGAPFDHSAADSSPTTLLVAEFTLKLKYTPGELYSCVHFGPSQSDENGNSTSLDDNEATGELRFMHQGNTRAFSHIITTKDLLPIYLVVIFYLILLCFSALCSGLNLGLMSLDLTELNILKKIGTKNEKKYAQKIFPLRAKGNRLLCTILLGNVLVNSTSTLILGSYLEGIFAAIGSTLLIVIFGEIIPQAICSRHGLAVGSFTRHITYGMMIATFPLAYPLGKILDFFLGKETAVSYSRDKVRELVCQAKDSSVGIKDEQFKFITAALDFKSKRVKDIMVPIRDVFALDINSILDFETFKTILYHGYSRIPVYEHTPENFVGMILIQDLLLNDPADKVPLRAVMDFYKHTVPRCTPKDSLESMFEKFRKGTSHMAFVYPDEIANQDLPNEADMPAEAVGIVTLENIIEELVQSEIMDEADKKREKRRKRARNLLKGKLANLSLSNENLNIFVEEDQTNKPLLSSQIRKALFYFLSSSVKPFMPEYINPRILETFLRQPELIIEKRNLSQDENDKTMYLYEYGVPCDYFIVILDGCATVIVGKEGMEINAGLFSYYGINALVQNGEEQHQHQQQQHSGEKTTNLSSPTNNSNTTSTSGVDLSVIQSPVSSGLGSLSESDLSERKLFYKPEFSLIVNSYCVYMKVTRRQWLDAVKKSMLERIYHQNAPTVTTTTSNEATKLSNTQIV